MSAPLRPRKTNRSPISAPEDAVLLSDVGQSLTPSAKRTRRNPRINEVRPSLEKTQAPLPPVLEAMRAACLQVNEKENRPVLWRPLPNIGFAPLLWDEGLARVKRLAEALVAHDIEPGDRAFLTVSGDWITMLIAALATGAEVCLFSNDPEMLLPSARLLGARFILTDASSIAELKAAQGKARTPRIISDEALLERVPEATGAVFFRTSPKAAIFVDPALSERRSKRALTESSFSIEHQPFFELCQKFLKLFGLTHTDHVLSLLPSSQPAMLSAGLIAPLMAGATLHVDPGAHFDSRQLTVFRPSVVLATQAQWHLLGERIKAQLVAASTRGRWAREVALRRNEMEAKGKPIPPSTNVKYRLGQQLGIAPLKRLFGLSRVRLAIVADTQGPLDPDLIQSFAAIDLPLHSITGSPATFGLAFANAPDSMCFNSLGRPFPGLSARIDDKGALWLKGTTLAKEALGEEGWLREIDQAEIDFQGFVHVVDNAEKDISPKPSRRRSASAS